jgi:hypothetical protein
LVSGSYGAVVDVRRLAGGNLLQLACRLLPGTDTSRLAKDYGVAVKDPICGPGLVRSGLP